MKPIELHINYAHQCDQDLEKYKINTDKGEFIITKRGIIKIIEGM